MLEGQRQSFVLAGGLNQGGRLRPVSRLFRFAKLPAPPRRHLGDEASEPSKGSGGGSGKPGLAHLFAPTM